jgi:hypothetical protein
MSCKGTCIRHKAKKISIRGYYVNGQKRCQVCDIYLNWEGFYCPCCGHKLRTGPRNTKYKIKMRAIHREVIQPIPILYNFGF